MIRSNEPGYARPCPQHPHSARREDAADIQVMLDLLENVVVLNKGINRGHGKNSRILSISGFRLVVLDDVLAIRDHRSSDI